MFLYYNNIYSKTKNKRMRCLTITKFVSTVDLSHQKYKYTVSSKIHVSSLIFLIFFHEVMDRVAGRIEKERITRLRFILLTESFFANGT